MGYSVLKLAILGWAGAAVVAHAYYWFCVATGSAQAEMLQVAYGESAVAVADTGLDFVMTSLVTASLVAAFWYAFQLVRGLEQAERAYSEVIRQLARFAGALCLYSVGAVLASVVMASSERFAATGELALALVVRFDQISLLIMSVVLFLVGNALRVANEAVEETRSFL